MTWNELKNVLTGKAPVHQEVALEQNRKEATTMGKKTIKPREFTSDDIDEVKEIINDGLGELDHAISEVVINRIEQKQGSYDVDKEEDRDLSYDLKQKIIISALKRLVKEYTSYF